MNRKTLNRIKVFGILGFSFSMCLMACQTNKPINDNNDVVQTGNERDELFTLYAAYLANGGTMSYADWLAYIKGENGKDGMTAYELAVENGFVGTEQEWRNYVDNAKPMIVSLYYDANGNLIVKYDTGLTVNAGYSVDDGSLKYDFYYSNSVHADKNLVKGNVFFPCYSVDSDYKPSDIYEGLFKDCTGLTSIYIADGYQTIGKEAFKNCSNLNTIYIPSTVTTICADAFEGCTNLSKVFYNGTLDEWRNIDFYIGDSVPTNYTHSIYTPSDNGEETYYFNRYTRNSIEHIDPSIRGVISVWVDREKVDFYNSIKSAFLSNHPDFDYKVVFVGSDGGANAAHLYTDNLSCGDVLAVHHSNIGKLSRLLYIYPIDDSLGSVSGDLEEQISNDNTPEIRDAVTSYYPGDTTYLHYFGAPFESQSQFLYYDKRYVTDEEANSFEGLMAAAKRYDDTHSSYVHTKAVAVTGTDGYNFSFPILARNLTAGNTSSLRLYENVERNDCYLQSNEQVAIVKWLQRYHHNHGIYLDSDIPWAMNIQLHQALSLIGGSWHANAFIQAVESEENVGIKPIPTFTLTSEDVDGIEQVNYPLDEGLPTELQGENDPAPTAGTIMRGGSFNDAYCYVINTAGISTGTGIDNDRYDAICEVVKYITSKEVQNAMFLSESGIPVYQNASDYIALHEDDVGELFFKIANAQTSMIPYGIPQPFFDGTTNTFYYSMCGPDKYLSCVRNTDNEFNTVDKIRAQLFNIEYTWKHGTNLNPASYPAILPADTTTKIN